MDNQILIFFEKYRCFDRQNFNVDLDQCGTNVSADFKVKTP